MEDLHLRLATVLFFPYPVQTFLILRISGSVRITGNCGQVVFPEKNILGESTDEAASFSNEGEFCSATNVDNSSECYVTADVIKYNASTYKMYAFGTSSSGQVIRSLSSTDGDTWTLDPTINLTVQSSSGVEDLDVWAPTVLELNDTSFLMVYETRIPSTASTYFSAIDVLQEDTAISIGSSLNLTARTNFADNSIRDVTFFGTWTSTNPTIASTNNYGKVTGLSKGMTYVYKTYDGVNSDSVLITVNAATTEIKDINNSLSGASIYQHPASNELILSLVNNREKVNFEIFNLSGKLVFKGSMTEKAVVQTNRFSPGVYVVKLENGKTFEFKKIIKE